MNKKTRKNFRLSVLALETKLENKYTGRVTKLLRRQISSLKAFVKANGLRAAIAKVQTMPVYDTAITTVLQKLHTEAAMSFGKQQYRHTLMLSKQPVKKESAAFGFSEGWNFSIIDFLSQYLLVRAVIPISTTTRKQLMDVLEQGQQGGWGVDRILTELEQVSELVGYRARRIVRTELAIAANFGNQLAEETLEFEVQREWITAHDHRVRSSHAAMDGVLVEPGDSFTVPIYKGKKATGTSELMNGPGDPNASPGNVINCRCTVALVPKRDENDELILKPKQFQQR